MQTNDILKLIRQAKALVRIVKAEVKEVTAWETSNGSLWKTKEEALRAEERQEEANRWKSLIAAKKKEKKKSKKPKKVTEIADAIKRDNKGVTEEVAQRQAWETYCSYVNPGYDGCTSKGKSKRKSPKSEYK